MSAVGAGQVDLKLLSGRRAGHRGKQRSIPARRRPTAPSSGRETIRTRRRCRSRRARRSSSRCRIAGTCRCRSGIATASAATTRTSAGHWWDPYNQNKLKGDYPVIGKRTFFTFTGISDSLLEGRNLPVPSGVSTAAPGQRAVLRARRHLRAGHVAPDVVRSVPRRHGVPPDRLARALRAGLQRELREPVGVQRRQRRRPPQETRASIITSASRSVRREEALRHRPALRLPVGARRHPGVHVGLPRLHGRARSAGRPRVRHAEVEPHRIQRGGLRPAREGHQQRLQRAAPAPASRSTSPTSTSRTS